jgi:hypothetical protein
MATTVPERIHKAAGLGTQNTQDIGTSYVSQIHSAKIARDKVRRFFGTCRNFGAMHAENFHDRSSPSNLTDRYWARAFLCTIARLLGKVSAADFIARRRRFRTPFA